MKKLLYIFLFLPVFAPAQVQMFFTSDSSAFITSPLDVDSLFYWFDASQGVFDSVGSVISNNQGVGEWKDLSGKGHHVTQGTNGARPQYQATGGPNNYPALYFDGSNDFLASAAHLWESNDITVFFVAKFFSATRNVQEIFLSKGIAAGNKLQFNFRGLNNQTGTINDYKYRFFYFKDGGVSNFTHQTNTSGTGKTAAYSIVTHTGNVGTQNFHLNGAAETYTQSTTGTGDNTIFDNADTGLVVGAADETSPVSFFQGYISEIIVFSRAVTTAERGAIEAYLNHKYKIF